MRRRPSPDTTIGERIRDRRLQRSWSIRHAADRAGISHATWSRIERGLQTADNRFVVADIAAALECSVAELVGAVKSAVADHDLISAQASVYAIREALLEAAPDERPTVDAPPLDELEREAALVGELRSRCDYAGAGRRLPALIRGLHAATGGLDREALSLMVRVSQMASTTCRYVGYPAEAWLAAEWGRRAAERMDGTWSRPNESRPSLSTPHRWPRRPPGGCGTGPVVRCFVACASGWACSTEFCGACLYRYINAPVAGHRVPYGLS
jgi:transcriptional regulator with XRE-family HTH domain